MGIMEDMYMAFLNMDSKNLAEYNKIRDNSQFDFFDAVWIIAMIALGIVSFSVPIEKNGIVFIALAVAFAAAVFKVVYKADKNIKDDRYSDTKKVYKGLIEVILQDPENKEKTQEIIESADKNKIYLPPNCLKWWQVCRAMPAGHKTDFDLYKNFISELKIARNSYFLINSFGSQNIERLFLPLRKCRLCLIFMLILEAVFAAIYYSCLWDGFLSTLFCVLSVFILLAALVLVVVFSKFRVKYNKMIDETKKAAAQKTDDKLKT